MTDIGLLLLSTALFNNLFFSYLLGLDLQVSASQRLDVAWQTGLMTTLYLSLCLPTTYLVDEYLIIPLQLDNLALLFYMLLILVIVFGVQQLLNKFMPLIYQRIVAITPMILMNSVLLAIILLRQQQLKLAETWFSHLILGLATGLGLLFLLLTLSCLRERCYHYAVPKVFYGTPILMIALGIFAMGLMGLEKFQ